MSLRNTALMLEHLLKEDRFYKVAYPVLHDTDHVELKAVFDKLEQETVGADGYTHYCQWVHQLAGAHL